MSTIDLYQVLRQIPNVTEQQAKQAVTDLERPERIKSIEERIKSIEERIKSIEERVKNTEERLIKVETKINYSIVLQIGIFLTALGIAFG